MKDSKFSKLFSAGSPEKEADEPLMADELEEDLGKCAAIAKEKWVTALTVKQPKDEEPSFQYRGLATRRGYLPTRFWVRFVDEDATWEIVVSGRNLLRIYCLIIQHRLEWIRAADRDYAESKEPIIR